MIAIDDKIISEEILTESFCCDLDACRGACCIEGDAGAPLEFDEVDTLEDEYPNYAPMMSEEGRNAIDEQGFMVVDTEGDYTTPLIDGGRCAFCIEENGTALCAIEKAYRAGKTSFIKPISCHLYPIRVKQFSDGSYGLNYHRWSVCECACSNGIKRGIKVYESLREPIIRRFGTEFYQSLDEIAHQLTTENSSIIRP